jgi:hypothetical protein
MPDESVFSKEDLVDNDALPPELVGKTPKEIAQFYARREQILIDRAQRTPPERENQPPAKEEKFDIFNDAENSVTRIASREANEAVSRVANVAAPAVIASCRMLMKENHSDWAKIGPEVEKRMKGFTAEGQMNPDFWENTYKIVKGEMSDRLVEEAVQRAKNPVERSHPPSADPPAPRALTADELKYAGNFKMSAEQYRAAAERYESTDGTLPFTLDSAKPKQKRKAS